MVIIHKQFNHKAKSSCSTMYVCMYNNFAFEYVFTYTPTFLATYLMYIHTRLELIKVSIFLYCISDLRKMDAIYHCFNTDAHYSKPYNVFVQHQFTVATSTDSHHYQHLTDRILMRLVSEMYVCGSSSAWMVPSYLARQTAGRKLWLVKVIVNLATFCSM